MEKIGFVPPPPGLSTDTVVQSLKYDKKKEGGKLVFVLPHSIGKADFCYEPPDELIVEVISAYLS